MYEKIDVWKRIGGGALIRFQCVRRISDNMFAVQNADYIRAPVSKSEIQQSDFRFVEFLLDDDPADRCKWYSTMQEAILMHECEFEDMPGKL